MDPPDIIRPSHHPASPSASTAASSVSRVNLDSFNAEGVAELRRSLTKEKVTETTRYANIDLEKASAITDGTLHGEPFDLEKVLRDTVQRREDAQIKPRSIGVGFRNLTVVGLGASDTYLPTMGTIFSPSAMMENVRKARHPHLRNILQGIEGVVRPGEMLLVLGSPGAGCTTLLKTLSNQRKEYYSVQGDVHYDSLSPKELDQHFRGDVQYCPEDDVHFPTLSVDQTLHFAATMRTPRERAGETRNDFARRSTDLLTTIFGLKHAKDTPIGDAAIRGVSGGEKKRVSIAEALAARSCIGAWDNSTRGLDASTALEFVKALRVSTDVFQTTTIVSLYQAGESLYQHFDKVCVLYEGRMAYFGPANQAKRYFLDMGYQPANRQTTPDFLVAVTDVNARIHRPGSTNQPQTAQEFADYFIKSNIGQLNHADMEEYLGSVVGRHDLKNAYIQSARHELAKRSRNSSPYLLSIPEQLSAVVRRKVQIIRGSMLATGLNLFSFVFQGLILGSVYFKMPQSTDGFFPRGGILFFVLFFAALSSLAEMPMLYAQRPIVARHQKAAFYHPFIEAAALTIVDIPITIVICTVFTIILYFMIGLQKTPVSICTFLLFEIVTTLTMKGWFRAVAAAFVSEASAQSFAGISILALAIYTSYFVPRPSMIACQIWVNTIPLHRIVPYLTIRLCRFEALMGNEFHTLEAACSNLVPRGPGYENITLENQVCATVGAVSGQPFVDGNRFIELSYSFKHSHIWMNLGIVIAFGIGFTIALLTFTEFNTKLSSDTSVTLFKRGAKSHFAEERNDEEKGDDTLKRAPTSATKEKAPTPKMTDVFSWQHISYTVPIPGHEDRKLLDDVSGYVAPGKLTALMGESGAGKTTLLNALAQRTDVGVVTGDRLVNGQPLPADFQAQTGYCQQMDTHMPFATVREALLFSAKLRQPASVPLSEKEAYVEKCLEMCGLEEYADASVGSLSIEHRKRTTIGVELAAKPKLLLFLDEPTSGLDSRSAWAIITFLQTLASRGQAILCTYPSAELFQAFDRLLLLRKGGQTVYFGDLGLNATKLLNYFERNGARKCQEIENPAEYMLDVIGAGATATSEQDWRKIWLASPEADQVRQEIQAIINEGRSRPPVEATFHSEFASSWMYQARELVKRNSEAYWRDPTYIMAKLVLNVFGGLFIGFTFWKGRKIGFFVPLSNQLQIPFIATRSVYEIRERPSRMYSWTALVTSQILVELPWNFLGSALLFFSWYWTVGFESSRAGYTFLMMTICWPFYYTTFAQAVTAMAPNVEIAAILFSLLFSFVITFNGVVQPFSQLGWWKWMYRLSPFTYLIEGILGQGVYIQLFDSKVFLLTRRLAMGRRQINCSPIELVRLNPPSGLTCGQYMDGFISKMGGYVTDPNATSACGFCSVRTTDQFLNSAFNIFYENHWRNFGIMMGYIVFNVGLVFAMTYIFRIHKGSFFPSFKKSS
ncbi:pleiotropic drug resistance ABC transporter [Panaeolus papilionaceus]|nr:pleiotropic drug resistance ABC transporter [Panaeolus papilionaceus]